MRGGLSRAMVVVGSMALGCGGTVRPATAPEGGLPLRLPPAPAAAPPPADEPEPSPPAPGEATGPCPLHWEPHELHTSVFTLPAELNARMMIPLVRALCVCTRPGQMLAVVATLVPDHGEVTAVTQARLEPQTRVSRSIDACLAKELGAGRFEPFHVGTDSFAQCDPPQGPAAARQPGEPLHLAAPRRADCVPEEERFATITTPLIVDRRDER